MLHAFTQDVGSFLDEPLVIIIANLGYVLCRLLLFVLCVYICIWSLEGRDYL
jgi:hypothetical protein